MDCLSFVKLFEPFFYCVAKIMFVSQQNYLLHKYSFFERAKSNQHLCDYQQNLKMHQHLVLIIIIAPRNQQQLWLTFSGKKDFLQWFKTNPNGHISPKVIWNINSIQWYLGLVIKPSAACVERIDLRRSNIGPALCCRIQGRSDSCALSGNNV